jgi:hypothetical protein
VFIGAGFDHHGGVARHPAVTGLLDSQIQDELQERVHDPDETDALPARHGQAGHTGRRVQVRAGSFPYRKPETIPRQLARLTPRPPDRRTSHSRARHPGPYNARTEINSTQRGARKLAVPPAGRSTDQQRY